MDGLKFITPEKVFVVRYKEPQLILSAIRNNLRGNYMLYEDMVKKAKKFNIPVVNAWRLKAKTVRELVEEVKGTDDVEGCVLGMDSGKMYKIKTLFYVKTGKGDSDLLAQEHTIWKLILGEKIDDYKASGIQKALKYRIEKFSSKLLKNIQETSDNFEEMKKGDFEIELKKKSEIEQKILSQIYKDKDPLKSLINVIVENLSKGKMEKIRYLAGNIRFY